MGRLLLACILGCAMFAGAAWQLGYFDQDDQTPTPNPATGAHAPSLNLGDDLYAAELVPVLKLPVVEQKVDPVVILGTMAVTDRAEIPAQVEGLLAFIGEEIPEGAAQAAGSAFFVADPFESTTINHGVRQVVQFYRRLNKDEVVYKDQILALVDTAKVSGDLEMKQAKLQSAKFDYQGASAIAAEAKNKYEQARAAYYSRVGRALSEEDYRNAILTRDKMEADGYSKLAAWEYAKKELQSAQTLNSQHRVRNKIKPQRAVIKKFLKSRGDGVKQLEPVVEVYGLDRLLAEAQIDEAYAPYFKAGTRVTLEPKLVDAAPKTYPGHKLAVNCLAVTHDAKNPLIISGGEDKVVLVWNRYIKTPIDYFPHSDAVKALVTSPPEASDNYFLTGSADGEIRLYDLDTKEELKRLTRAHDVSITALAFSPDGKYFASGAADGTISLWETATREKVYPFDDEHGVSDQHHGAVTSLHFTKQCKLVSASVDNSIVVWSLKQKGAVRDYDPQAGRSGTVTQLDVSSNGRWMLFDQGKNLQILGVEDGRLINSLKNPGGAIPFETLAVFSPDASMLLTAGAAEGRLQLWYLPEPTARAYEVRQFAPAEHVAASCAAFAPRRDYNGAGSFAVSANKEGQIYLWPLPSRRQISEHRIIGVPVLSVSAGLNPSTRQQSINIEVANPSTEANPNGRLEPGRQVAIVVENDN